MVSHKSLSSLIIMKHFISFIFILSFLGSSAQTLDFKPFTKDNRKGLLFFSVGTDYRITPSEKRLESPTYSAGEFRASIDEIGAQNAGVGFRYDLNYFLTTSLSLGFSNSLRYDIQLSDRSSLTTDSTGPKSKTLLVDYHFYADYHFKAFANSELVLRLGRSYLNNGSQITAAHNNAVSDFSFDYWSWNMGLGYKKQRTHLMLGVYSSSTTNYPQTESLVIPYLSFTYNLKNLWE